MHMHKQVGYICTKSSRPVSLSIHHLQFTVVLAKVMNCYSDIIQYNGVLLW